MGMASTKQDTDVMAEINITPFTDVLLVLLIIFMILAALAAPPGFQKQLPKKNNQPQTISKQTLQHQIEVQVTAQNRIYIDQKLIPTQDLYNVMANTIAFHRSHANQGYTQHVSLIADQDASYNTIIKILDAARAAGNDDVGFVTE
jgi:biopolymer transport protein ExbD